ncbi:MAG: hypothetical protein K2I71_00230, partial [Helicobacter sp.]|nr:hypothetical protein [Helicobacter sp.]
VITDNSSVAYSIPWVHCKPVLLYAPNKKEWDLKQIRFGHSFANIILHRVAETPNELLKQAEQLQKDIASNAKEIKREIRDYRTKVLINFGKSQEAIEKILLDLFKKSTLSQNMKNKDLECKRF